VTEAASAPAVDATASAPDSPTPSSAPPADGGGAAAAPGGRRGRPPGRLARIRGDLSVPWRIGLGVVGLVVLFGLWLLAAAQTAEADAGIAVPYPGETWRALVDLQREGLLWADLKASGTRMIYGYAISMAIGIVLGVGMGALPGIEAGFEAPIGFLRYIPASALTPLMLLWLGLDESPKITLIVLGTVFFNILMVADVARSVPREMVAAASTLGASRTRTLLRVIVPHSVPGIVDVARINLAAGWLMLVVAELLATDEGLAVRVVRSTRFLAYDRMFAILIVFGVIGMLSDLVLRGLRWGVAAWAR
jgi:NitT/TauT family transport system permease protein